MAKTKTNKTTARKSVYNVTPSAVAEKVFTNKLNCGNDATNIRNTLQTFLRVASEVEQTKRSFTWEDFWQVSKRFSMDVRDCKNLFTSWIETQIQCGRLETVNGCYDSPTYVRVGV